MSDNLIIDNVTIAQGATFVRRYPVVLSSAFASATAAAQVRAKFPDVSPLYAFTITMIPDPDPVTNPNTGLVQISAPTADSWGFNWTTGFFDVLVTEVNGTKDRIAQGTVTVNLGVTR